MGGGVSDRGVDDEGGVAQGSCDIARAEVAAAQQVGRLSSDPRCLGVSEDAGEGGNDGGMGEVVSVTRLAGDEVVVWERVAWMGADGANGVVVGGEVWYGLEDVVAQRKAEDMRGRL